MKGPFQYFSTISALVCGVYVLVQSCSSKVPENTSASPSPKQEQSPTQSPSTQNMDTTVTKDYLMGKIDPAKDERFVAIAKQYSDGSAMFMRKEAYNSFIEMFNAAKKDGVNLRIISATRPFNHQKRIWEEKWTGKRAVDGKYLTEPAKDPAQRALLIMRWSSMPGTSRHHWGTDIDINKLENSYFASGTGKKEYDWLVKNAPTYGFCQVYSAKPSTRKTGYEEEKWHWSYMPLARNFTAVYKQLIQNEDINGFEGSSAAKSIDAIGNYVLGINPDCL